jgi:hypothetical protein
MTTIREQFNALKGKKNVRDYNYKHFHAGILLEDVRRTIKGQGIKPGTLAPDFELPKVGGGSMRLSDLRGKPVLLHFGSFS